jgi:hypothetical protein
MIHTTSFWFLPLSVETSVASSDPADHGRVQHITNRR